MSFIKKNPLYDYAARNWGYYARVASTEVGQLILGFLSKGLRLQPGIDGFKRPLWLQPRRAKANNRSIPCSILRTRGHDNRFTKELGVCYFLRRRKIE